MASCLVLTESSLPVADGTDWREVARAMKAANPEITNAEIGQRLGRTSSAVTKALNPEKAREWAREQNAKRHEIKLAWQREKDHSLDGRATCERCGKPCGVGSARGGSRICADCLSVAHAERAMRFVELWNSGAKYSEIEAVLGISKGTVSSALTKLRAEGYDLPHRRTPEQRERIYAARWGGRMLRDRNVVRKDRHATS